MESNVLITSKFRWQFFVQLSIFVLGAFLFSFLIFLGSGLTMQIAMGFVFSLIPILLFKGVKKVVVTDEAIEFYFLITRKKRIVPFETIKGCRTYTTQVQHKAGRTDPIENFELKTKDNSVYGFSRSEFKNYHQVKRAIYKKMYSNRKIGRVRRRA